MKIVSKLAVMMIGLSVFIASAFGAAMIIMSGESITSLSHDKALATAKDNAGEIGNLLTPYWYISKSLADVMENYDDIMADNRRSYINNILKATVENHENVVGVWAVWEKDVLEGNDLQYADVPGSTNEGRFSPY